MKFNKETKEKIDKKLSEIQNHPSLQKDTDLDKTNRLKEILDEIKHEMSKC